MDSHLPVNEVNIDRNRPPGLRIGRVAGRRVGEGHHGVSVSRVLVVLSPESRFRESETTTVYTTTKEPVSFRVPVRV